jgi:hypothetical protein
VSAERRTATLALCLAAASAALVGPATPASADPPARFRVDSTISVGIVDDEGLLEDEHCGFGGTTSQELVQSSTPVQLGTGKPEVDYFWNRGPFRNRYGDAVSFFCGGEVSVCFHPSTVAVSPSGGLSITMLVSMFEGDGLAVPVVPCIRADWVAGRTVTLTVPAGTRGCLGKPVVLNDSGGDQATIGSFCASATRIDTPAPPLPNPPVITGFACDSIDAQFTCDMAHSGGVPPVTIHWFIDASRRASFDGLDSVSGTCVVGTFVSVRVVVSDSTAASDQRTASRRCLDQGV